MNALRAIEVVDEATRARALMHPARRALLECLDEPSSAAALARRLDQPRQRVNYHLRELESEALVEMVEERRRGSVTERVYRRVGRSYAISSAALGRLGSRPEQVRDRFSSDYQIALAARAVEELGALREGADAAGKKLATLSLETEVAFESPEERHAFAEELSRAVAELSARYHRPDADGARAFRLYVGAYPRPTEPVGTNE